MNVTLWFLLFSSTFYFSGARQTLPLDGPEIVIEIREVPTPKDQDPIIAPEPTCFGRKGQQECF